MMREISILHSLPAMHAMRVSRSYFRMRICACAVDLIFGGKASSYNIIPYTSLNKHTRKAFLGLLKPQCPNKMSKPVKRGASSRKHAASKAEELTTRLAQWTEGEMGLPRGQVPPNDQIKMQVDEIHLLLVFKYYHGGTYCRVGEVLARGWLFLINAHHPRLLCSSAGNSMWQYLITHINTPRTVQLIRKNIQL